VVSVPIDDVAVRHADSTSRAGAIPHATFALHPGRLARARSTRSRVSERPRSTGPCSFDKIACLRATGGAGPSRSQPVVALSRSRHSAGRAPAGLADPPSLAPAAQSKAPAAHSKAPEGTGGRTGQSVRTGSEQVRSRYAPPRDPRSVTLRPSNPVPGTVPRIAPRCGLAVRTCPFGQHEMYRPRSSGHNRLIHELRGNPSRLIPDFPPDVDGMWTSRVATSAQRRGDVDSRDGGG
jgi:hypothetical protein